MGKSTVTNITNRPFKGAFATPPPAEGAPYRPRFFPPRHDKMCSTIDEALKKIGIQDGWSIGYNHDLRNGDRGLLQVIEACGRLGVKDLILYPTALFPCHAPLKKYITNGIIRRIEGSMNGALGDFVSEGNMKECAVLRSHGGRVTAVSLGYITIDLTVCVASAADYRGNANGVLGKTRLGALGYTQSEISFSKNSLVITDTIVDYPCLPNPINQASVDYVVKVDSIGDADGISFGSTQIREREPELTICGKAVDVMRYSGLLKNGCVIQAGAGAATLLALKRLGEYCQENKIQIGLCNGGTTSQATSFLNNGVVKNVTSGQVFDAGAVDSLLHDYPRHVMCNLWEYYGCYSSGCMANDQDFALLSATEIDVDFNVNANTHSDGYVKHGTGGHQDVAAAGKISIVMCPTYRKTNPIVVDRVTSVTTPGECVDVVVTEVGVCVNPKRSDLIELFEQNGMELVAMEHLRDVGAEKAGKSYTPPPHTDRIIAVIEWRDGTVLDVVYEVKKE